LRRWPIRFAWLVGVFVSTGSAAGLIPSDPFRSLGPFGGRISDLRQDPTHADRLYAAVGAGGVYRSDDGGLSWSPARQGLPLDAQTSGNTEILGLAVDVSDGRVYATMQSGDVYKTDDGGNSWQLLPRPQGPRGGLSRLIIDRDDPNRICASNGPLGKGVYVSLDRGQTWTASNEGLASPVIRALVDAPSDPHVFFLVAADKLYRATAVDGAWDQVGPLPGGAFASLRVDPYDSGVLWLATHQGAFRSGDGGETWDRLDDAGHPVDAERIIPGEVVILVARGEIYEVDGDGALVTRQPFYHTPVTGAAVRDDGTVLVATAMGVFRGNVPATNGAFTYACNGMLNTDISRVAPARNSPVLYAATGLGVEAGVFRSPDGGQTWELRSLGLTNLDIRSLAVAPGNPDVVYAGTVDATSEGGDNGRIFRTTDGGLTWTDISAGIEAVHHEARIIIDLLVSPTNPDMVWASVQGLFGGVFYTANGGATWQKRSQGLVSMPDQGDDWSDFVNYFAMLSLDMDPWDPNRLYIGAGGCWGGVYISDNQGLSWVRKDQNAMEIDETIYFDFLFGLHLELFDFNVDPQDPNHLITGGGRGLHPDGNPQLGIVFESKDRGLSWHLIHEKRANTDYFDNPVTGVIIDPVNGQRLYVASRGGVQVSEAGGAAASWTFINEGLDARAKFTRNAVMDPDDPGSLYVGTALSGVWVRQVNIVPVRVTHAEGVPEAGRVVLTWGVADAVGHAGFHVDREARGVRSRLTPELLAGSDEYRFEDGDPVLGVTNRYRVVEVDRRGVETVVATLEVPVPLGPGLVLGAAFPNPVREATRLRFTTDAEAPVRARVYDSRGRIVATLLEEMLPPGTRDLVWNRLDDASRRVSAGFYVIQLEGSGQAVSRKVLVLP